MKKLSYFLLSVLLIQSCVSMAIDGGEFATLKDAESQSSVLVKFETKSGEHTCSGTLISPSLVLTAAHCFISAGTPKKNSAGDLFPKFTVELMREIKPGSQYDYVKRNCNFIAPVLDYKTHKDFGKIESFPYTINDIALLKISPDSISCDYTPAALLTNKIELSSFEFLYLAGFGPSVSHPSSYYHTLRKVKTTFRSHSKKHKVLEIKWQQNTNLNRGDSGGPGFVKIDGELVLAGVCSTGTGYASVPSYLEWIKHSSFELGEKLIIK